MLATHRFFKSIFIIFPPPFRLFKGREKDGRIRVSRPGVREGDGEKREVRLIVDLLGSCGVKSPPVSSSIKWRCATSYLKIDA
jgi:hypothetical protein